MKETKTVDAPYVEPDSTQLGDGKLDYKEGNAKYTEDILRIEAKKRIYGQDELEKSERSLGPRTYYTEILRRLKHITNGLQVREGSPGAVSLYFPKRKEEYTESDYAVAAPGGDFFIDHKYVGGMLKDWLPEWGHVTIDSSMIAEREVRGWRSVLLRLIKQDVISYHDAVEQFGNPILDSRSRFWFEQTQKFRK